MRPSHLFPVFLKKYLNTIGQNQYEGRHGVSSLVLTFISKIFIQSFISKIFVEFSLKSVKPMMFGKSFQFFGAHFTEKFIC